MSKKANPTTVGAFLVGAVALAVGGILTFGSGDFFREELHFVAHFTSSVKGLDVGAPIRVRGVQVGTVTGIEAVWDAETETILIPVSLSFTADSVQTMADHGGTDKPSIDHLVELGLRAELSLDSFVTGKLFVALEFYPDSPVNLVGGTELPELPTTENALERLAKSLEDIPVEKLVERSIVAVDAVTNLVSGPTAEETRANLNRLLRDAADRIGPLADSTQATLDETRGLVGNADTQLDALSTELRELLASSDAQLAAVSDDLRALLRDVDEQVEPTSAAAIAALDEARGTIARLHDALDENYSVFYRTNNMVDELGAAARAIRVLAEMLERHPEAPLTGKPGR